MSLSSNKLIDPTKRNIKDNPSISLILIETDGSADKKTYKAIDKAKSLRKRCMCESSPTN
jgi:hypothetical protein